MLITIFKAAERWQCEICAEWETVEGGETAKVQDFFP
jgi:hypothetical protein